MPRKRIDIDPKTIERLAAEGRTLDNIAWVLGVGKTTIYNRISQEEPFLEAYRRGCAEADGKLLLTQMEVAVKDKNPTMLIWLGKQRLGQRDNKDIAITKYVENMDDETLLKNARELLKGEHASDNDSAVH